MLLLTSLAERNLHAQPNSHWQKMTTPLDGVLFRSSPYNTIPYFINEQVGFICSAWGGAVYRTIDGCVSWTKCAVSEGQFCFVSPTHGYLVNGEIWETFDTGSTWRKLPSPGCDWLYANRKKIYAGINNGLISSQDDGLTWKREFTSLKTPYVFGNKDDIVYAAYDSSGFLIYYYSVDNGNTWQSYSLDPSYAWLPSSPETYGFYSLPHCKDVLRTQFSPYVPKDRSSISLSNALGGSWKLNLPIAEIGAWIAGINSCALYVSDASDSNDHKLMNPGLYRSTDGGTGWTFIPGPDFEEIDDHDWHNLSVVGNGAVVYTTGKDGNLWRTTDGGDGSLTSFSLAPTFDLTSDNIPQQIRTGTCDTLRYRFFLQANGPCGAYAQFENLFITRLDTSEYHFTFTNHYACGAGSRDTGYLIITPHYAGDRFITIRPQYSTDENIVNGLFYTDLNTFSSIRKLSMRSPRLVSVPHLSINFGTVRFCSEGSGDTVHLATSGCSWINLKTFRFETDSLTQKDFSFVFPAPNTIVTAERPEKITLTFKPKSVGLKSGKLIVSTNSETDTIFISANVIPDTPKVLLSKDHVDFGASTLCASFSPDTLFLSNPSCNEVTIRKIAFEADSMKSDFSLFSSGSSKLLNDSVVNRIVVAFHPHSTGNKEGRIIIETSIGFDTISLKASATDGVLSLNQQLINFDTVSTCITSTKSASLINDHCDSMLISEFIAPAGAPFVKTGPPLPFWLHAGDSMNVTFMYAPQTGGPAQDSIIFLGKTRAGDSQYLKLTLVGYGEKNGGTLSYSPRQFDFHMLSICATDSAVGFITNSGCDSAALDPAKIFGDPDYTLQAGSLQPILLAPKDTFFYHVSVHPSQKGLRTGFLIFTSNFRRDSIPLRVMVTDGLRILSSSIAAMDFGSVSVCDEHDTTLTLRNSGCDTLIVTGAGFQGAGFGSNAKFPFIILPGKDTTIDIFTLLDTTGGKSMTNGTITINANADSILAPIPLLRTFVPAARRDLGLYLDATPKAGTAQSTVTYDMKESPGKTFTGAGIKNITFDLQYNTDLLSFDPSGSSNVTSADGKRFTISNANGIQADASGVLASVAFTAYLTKDSTTSIVLANATIDTVQLPCTITTFAYSGSAGFDYHFLCGQRLISGFMGSTMPMKIVALRPNPAQDEIELDLQSAIQQDAKIEIFDALGAEVISSMKNLPAASSSIHLDTKDLPGGMYIVRISLPTTTVSRLFIISR